MKNIKNNESGVSSVIGQLLMVALTVALAAVLAIFVMAIKPLPMSPVSAITVESSMNTQAPDISMTHRGGDGLPAGDWWVSIVPEGQALSFRKMNVNFTVGDMISSRIGTEGSGNYSITNGQIQTNGTADLLVKGMTYQVKIKYEPLQSISMDTTVVVR